MARPIRVYDYYKYNTYQHTGTVKELAESTGLSFHTVYRMPRLEQGETLDPEIGKHHLKIVDTIKSGASEFTYYKGEEIVMSGTLEEIAKATGIKKESLRWYSTPAAKRRGMQSVLVRLDDEDEGA